MQGKGELKQFPFCFAEWALPILLAVEKMDDNKTGESRMREAGTGTELLEKAMEALEESTTMLKVAGKLLDQGNVEEARRLRDEARTRRNISVWLMAKANTLEEMSHGSVQGRHRHSQSSTGH